MIITNFLLRDFVILKGLLSLSRVPLECSGDAVDPVFALASRWHYMGKRISRG